MKNNKTNITVMVIVILSLLISASAYAEFEEIKPSDTINFEVAIVTGSNDKYVFTDSWVLDKNQHTPNGSLVLIVYYENVKDDIYDDKLITYYILK